MQARKQAMWQVLAEFATELLEYETTGTFFNPEEVRILRAALESVAQALRLQASDLKAAREQLATPQAANSKQTVAQLRASLEAANVVLFPVVARQIPADAKQKGREQ